MTLFFKKFLIILTISVIIFGVNLVLVQGSTDVGGETGGSDFSFSNPLKADNFAELASNVIKVLRLIGAPIAVMMVIWSGFLFMTSGGVQERLDKAKSTLMWTVVGLIVLIIAENITTILDQLLEGG